MTVVPQGAILKVQTPEITVWAFFFLLCESGQIRHFWAQIFLFRDVLRWRKTLRMFQLPEPFYFIDNQRVVIYIKSRLQENVLGFFFVLP